MPIVVRNRRLAGMALLSPALLLATASGRAQSAAVAGPDFANTARYAAQNQKLLAGPPDSNRVVFMGDSITEHWIMYDPAFFKDHPFVDRGIYGQTTPQMLGRLQPDVIALQPRVMVLMAGINDLAGNTGPESVSTIEANLAAMVHATAEHHIRTVLSSILPVSDVYKQETRTHNPALIRELNAWMASYCGRGLCRYLDYTSAVSAPDGSLRADLTQDGIHPNVAGYKVMEPLVLAAIRKTEQ